MEFSEYRNCRMDRNLLGVPNNSAAYRSRLSTKLQEIFMSDNPTLSYADFHRQFTRNADSDFSKSPSIQQSSAVEREAEEDELVRYMSKLPSYLEKGKISQEKPLNIGVLDWRHLENWKCNSDSISHESGDFSSTSRSSYLSAEGSSSHNCYPGRRYSHSPSRQRTYHLVPHSHHQKVFPWESQSRNLCRTTRNTDKFEEMLPSAAYHRITEKGFYQTDKTGSRGQSGVRMEMCDRKKTRMGENEPKEHNKVVLLVPRDSPMKRGLSQSSASAVSANLMLRDCGGRMSASKKDNHKEPRASSLSSYSTSTQRLESPARRRNTEDMKSIFVLKSPSKSSTEFNAKARQSSPIRRLSSAMGNIIRSAGSRDNSPSRRSCSKNPATGSGTDRAAVLATSETDTSPASCRARTSPLRRLLDPLIKTKASNARESSETPRKSFASITRPWKSSDDQLDLSKAKSSNVKKGSSPIRALLQVAVNNGLPLFTLAVDNDNDILAATLRKLNTAEKNCSGWIYTFFTVQEMKKKNALWPNQGSKGNGHFVPNVVAQMKATVNGRECNNREFTLFSVDVDQVDQNATEFQPTDELAAIIVKLSRPSDPSHIISQPNSSNISLNTTVILPGGVHTVPSKGSISTLTQRWRSGGACDCGGWDLGCQLRVFSNLGESQKSVMPSKTSKNPDEFKLFCQVGQERRLVLSMNPFKENIYSVEFDSSISLLQAFANCVAFLDCKRPSGLYSKSNSFERRSSISGVRAQMKSPHNQLHTEASATASYVSYPHQSSVERV